MLKSKKAKEPEDFSRYMKHHKLRHWEDADGNEKARWRAYILQNEQNGSSLYTEEPCGEHSHIGHFRKRSDFPNLTFSWSNFIVDGINEEYGAKHKDKTKGMLDYDRLIDPVAEDPQPFFTYYADGSIEPNKELSEKDSERAVYTIGVFNLNHPSLKHRREEIFNTFNQETSNRAEAEQMAQSFSSYGFPSVVRQILSELE